VESSSPTVSARLTAQGSYLGTPTFIAPEQALGLEVDARADIYALGCVGWWLLTGELVFPTNDPTAALVAHMTEIPRPLRPLVPGPLPEALEAVIVRCLAKEPKDRPASAREIAQILRGIAFESGEVWTSERGQSWWRELRSSAPPPRTPAHSGIGVMDTILSEKPTRRPA